MSLSVEAITARYITVLRALSEIANAYYFQGRLDDAWRLFQAGESWLAAPEARPEDRVAFLLAYGQFLVEYYYLTRRAEDLMGIVAERARQAAEASQDQAAMATAHYVTGQALYFRNLLTDGGEYSAARASFEHASALCETIGDTYTLAETTFFTGLTYDRQGPDERSRQHYHRALELGERHGNKWAASEATRHLTDYSEGDQRLRYALRSLELRAELGRRVAMPSAQLLVSDLYISRGDLEQALDYCRQALLLAHEMGLESPLLGALLTRGEIAYQQGQYDAAREHYEQASMLAHRLNNARALAAAQEQLELLARESNR